MATKPVTEEGRGGLMRDEVARNPALYVLHSYAKYDGEKRTADSTVIPRISCASGLSFSLQASRGHYCSPREHDLPGMPWFAFEIGYPTRAVDDWKEYAEEPGRLTSTVYGYVPDHKVNAVIAANGGLSKRTLAALAKARGEVK